MSDEEKKAIERIEDFLTTNIIISISNDETANSEELKAFISKNEYLSIEFIASTFLKQYKEIEEYKECQRLYKRQLEKQKNDIKTLEIEIEELKEDSCCMTNCVRRDKEKLFLEDKIKAKIEELDYNDISNFERRCKQEVLQSLLEKE